MKRLGPALVLAGLAHAGLLGIVVRSVPPQGPTALAPREEPTPIEVTFEAPEAPRLAAVATAAAVDPSPGADEPRPREPGAKREPREAPPPLAGSGDVEAPPAPATSFDPFAKTDDGADRERRARDALAGLASGKTFLPGADRDAPRTDAPKPAASLDLDARTKRSITDGLDARDRSLGLGAGSAVANAAHAAMIGPGAPREGAATIEVRLDGQGNVVSLRIASSKGGPWDPLLAVLRAQLARRKLTVPPASNGALLAVRVEARLQMPSASDHQKGAAVRPEGAGVAGQFDLADIGAKPSRVVSARVVSEVRL